MNRDQLIRALRRYARKRDLPFELVTRKGKGSHYVVKVGERTSTLQSDLNPGRVERVLRQLGIANAEL